MALKKIFIDDEKVANIVMHPIRAKILRVMRDSSIPMTVKMISKEMNLVHGKVFYHVTTLKESGFLEQVKTKKINGITARFYLPTYDAIFFKPSKMDMHKIPYYDEWQKDTLSTITKAYCDEVMPDDINIDVSDSQNDRIYRNYFHLKEEDVPQLHNEILGLLKKYAIGDEDAIQYSVLIGIGKRRKKTFTNVDEIEIENDK